MKSASFLALLVFSVLLIVFALALVKPAAAEDPVIVGKWDRTDGVDVYTISANGTTQTIIDGQAYYGTWEYDGSSEYNYIFHWEHSPPGKAPFTDHVTVAADGMSYSGVNNYGDDFHCVRIGGPESTPAAGSGGLPIAYIAVGGGIAALVGVGAGVYYYFVAGGNAGASTAGISSALGSGTPGAVAGAATLIDPAMVGTVNSVLTNLFSETTTNIMENLGYDTNGIVTPNMLSTSNTSELTNQITQEQQLFNTLSTLISSNHEMTLSSIVEGTAGPSVPYEPPTPTQTLAAIQTLLNPPPSTNYQTYISNIQQAAATVLLTPQTTSDAYSIPPESTSC